MTYIYGKTVIKFLAKVIRVPYSVFIVQLEEHWVPCSPSDTPLLPTPPNISPADRMFPSARLRALETLGRSLSSFMPKPKPGLPEVASGSPPAGPSLRPTDDALLDGSATPRPLLSNTGLPLKVVEGTCTAAGGDELGSAATEWRVHRGWGPLAHRSRVGARQKPWTVEGTADAAAAAAISAAFKVMTAVRGRPRSSCTLLFHAGH